MDLILKHHSEKCKIMNIREIEKEKSNLILGLEKLKEEYLYISPILVNNEITGFKVYSEKTEFLGKLDRFPNEIGSEIFNKVLHTLTLINTNKDNLENAFKPIKEEGFVRGKSYVAGYFKLISLISEEFTRLVNISLRGQLLNLKVDKGLVIIPRSFKCAYDNTTWTTSIELFKISHKGDRILKSKIKFISKPLSDLQDILDEAYNSEKIELNYKKIEQYDEDLKNMTRLLFEKNNLSSPEKIFSLLEPKEIFEMLYNNSLIYFLSLCA